MNGIPAQPYPAPVVPALIEDAGGRVLIIRRSDTKYGHEGWCPPGGKIDYGQTIQDALALEIAEETSLQLLSSESFFFQNTLPMHPGGMHCINFCFHCRVNGSIRINDESSEFTWIGPAEINSYEISFETTTPAISNARDD